MSATIVNTLVAPVISPIEVVKTKKEAVDKKPVLSAKYSKFLVFGHWFIQQVSSDIEDLDKDALMQRLRVFDSIETQAEFFQTFLDDFKDANSAMKSQIRAFNKPLKPTTQKKTKKTKNIDNTDNADLGETPSPEPVKRGRKKKIVPVVTNFQDDFVAEIVALANNRADPDDTTAPAPAAPAPAAPAAPAPTEDKPKRKYTRKPKDTPVTPLATPAEELVSEIITAEVPVAVQELEVAAEVEEEAEEEVAAEVEEEAEAEDEEEEEEEEEEDDEEEIICKPILIKGTKYAIDTNNNVYDFITHELINTLDQM